jgi:hypothetical protein
MNHYARMGVTTVLMFIAMYILMYAMVDRLDNVYANLNQFLHGRIDDGPDDHHRARAHVVHV